MTNDSDLVPALQSGNCTLTVARDLTLILAWKSSGLSSITFANVRGIPRENHLQNPPFVTQTLRLLREYFDGTPVRFSQIPLDLASATAFQCAVWTACSRIPWGQTRSYKWIATHIGQPAAVRAVGNALSSNPLPIVVPCHRVIRSDGSLGGFRYRTDLKRRLLELEKR